MLNRTLVAIFSFCALFSFAQANTTDPTSDKNDKKGQKKIFAAQRILTPPKIDGILNDEIWKDTANVYTFSQLEPDNGADASFATQVQIYYDDRAIYVMARMHDPEPSQIQRELGLRDESEKNADHFAILFDTYKKGQNGFVFGVTAAGVQADAYASSDDFDDNWDAVWKSAVKIDDKGWVVEMEIPYYSIRFPKQEVQSWGLNIYRKIQRKREESMWNHVDKSIDGFVNQSGVLNGIEGVEPPLRLAFMPYASLVHSRDNISSVNSTKFNGGMDLKWGLNEAFTLDMSLIPDFSQVQQDDQVLNLSAFEVRFDENRPFFTEGTELFNRGGLFYSRRVGRTLGDFEMFTEYDTVITTPGSAPLLNATKVSGRTKKGLGVGVFNGLTRRTYAELATPADTNNYFLSTEGRRVYSNWEKREVLVDPLTNYNVLVLDQNLKNNSNIAIINTNVSRSDDYEKVNFTGTEFRLMNKTNTYQLSGFGAVGYSTDGGVNSNKWYNDKGFKYNILVGKVSGNWQFRFNRNVESDTYNPNDLGFLMSPNEISHWAQIRYNEFNPVWILNNWGVRVNFNHSQLYEPQTFTEANLELNFDTTFKNFWELGGYGGNISERYDYFESRNGTPFNKESSYFYGGWIGTDSRKAFYISIDKGRWKMPEWGNHDHWHGAFMRYRVNNKLSFRYSMTYGREYNARGFVTNMDDETREINDLNGKVIFGKRNIENVTNVIGANYTFNSKMGLNFRVRHVWSTVEYSGFYELDANGNLQEIGYSGINSEGNTLHNINYNYFTVNFNYSWQIAPGSFVTFNYQNVKEDYLNNVRQRYDSNFDKMVALPNQTNSNTFSIKLTYFIDYLTLKSSIKKSK